jgi:uncharacterized protein YutE (UPF0331/DUF86 family)
MAELDAVLLAKADTIERCVNRARAAHAASVSFADDPDAQDITVLNIIRACEAGMDIGMRMIRLHGLKLPRAKGDVFPDLAKVGALPDDLAGRLKRMAGFRNVAVHDYAAISLPIVESIVRSDLDDLLALARLALTAR